MDVRLSTEQKQLRDAAAQVVDRLGLKAVGLLDDVDRRGRLDAAVVESGWRELRAVNDDGQPWATGVEVALVAEQLGRGLADTAFIGPMLAVELRRLAGADPSSELETVALTRDLYRLATLNDEVLAIDAHGARTALLLAARRDGFALFAAPVKPQTSTGVDLTRPTLTIDSSAAVEVATPRLLTDADLTAWTTLGLTASCADLIGVMQGAIDLAVEYARDRRQFDTAIGAFQSIQHLLADALVDLEGTRSTTLHAAWSVDALAPTDALVEASAAKAYASRAARSVCEAAVQVHGGIGHTWECLAHVFLRRALVSIELFGGVGPNIDRVLVHAGLGAN